MKINLGILKTTMALAFIFLASCARNDLKRNVEPIPVVYQAEVEPELQGRLEKLSETMEQKRQEFHIPGMALAVVKDDRLIYARGFGMSDLENQVPVNPKTVFAIGSTTKAFTSALAAMMVEEGKMDWDDPITKYLPFMKLAVESDNPDDAATIRDMLSHQTGFARMSLLWAGGLDSRREILQDAVNAEPYVPLRSGFYYNNIMYLAVGEAIGEAAGSTWDQILENRIFNPLGMRDSTTSYETAQKNPRLSKGYMWQEETEEYKKLPMRNLYNIGPAGSINSNVMDMANWLRFQLNSGSFEGKRLVDEETLKETRKSALELGQNTSYGLGWFIQDWEGQTVYQHGGNIDGFAAMVALLPESNLGFVMLTNVTATPLQQISVNTVWNHLVGDQDSNSVADGDQAEKTEGNETLSFDPYLGEYIADFGPFKEAVFTVQDKDGKLAVDVPGQTLYELKPPDKDGKWFFVMTNAISVTFENRVGERYNTMRMQQSGLNFELPRKGVKIAPEIDESELLKFLGSYENTVFKGNATVLIKNHRLALDVPGEMVFELNLPDEKGLRTFRVKNELGVIFNTTEDGRVESLSFCKNGEEKAVMTRLNTGDNRIPTLDEVMELRKMAEQKAAIEKLGTFRLSGRVNFPQAGVKGSTTFTSEGIERFRVDMDFGKYGNTKAVVTPELAITQSTFEPFAERRGKYLKQAQNEHLAATFGDWRDFFDTVTVQNNRDYEGRKVHLVLLKSEDVPPSTLYVDAETGDILKQETAILIPGMGEMPVVNLFEDYREVEGVHFPFRIISSNEANGKTVIEYETLEANINPGSNIFSLKEE